jgi:hypothetical protein
MATATHDECVVCCTEFNKNTQAPIPCEHNGACAFVACKKCVRTYLLGTTTDPNCMQCNKTWSDKFLTKNLNASFMRTEYRIHRKELLIQQQISRMPETMAAAETYKRVKAITLSQKELDKEFALAATHHNHLHKMYIKQVRALTLYLTPEDNVATTGVSMPHALMMQYAAKKVLAENDVVNRPFHEELLLEIHDEYTTLTGEAIDKATLVPLMEEYVKMSQERFRTHTEYQSALTTKNLVLDNLRQLAQEKYTLEHGGEPTAAAAATAAPAFIMSCPNADCRGYLSENYKCELCEHHTCEMCLELIGVSTQEKDLHACKPDNVKSAEFIRKQSKPCPCCGTRISKIDGCDQMWCTQCHKAFSWDTGRIVTGVIHNPHFYQYQREHGGGAAPRNPGDVLCGGLPEVRELTRVFFAKMPRPLSEAQDNIVNQLWNIHQLQTHFVGTYINPLRAEILEEQELQHERILYILQTISREELGNKVMRKDSSRKKHVALLQICEVFTTVTADMFRLIAQSEKNPDEFVQELVQQLREYEALRTYCTEQFKEVSITYGVCVPTIPANWQRPSLWVRPAATTTKYTSKGEVDKYIEKRDGTRERKAAEKKAAVAARHAQLLKVRIAEGLALDKKVAQERKQALEQQARAQAWNGM